ncbi:MAG: hypothetical protein KY469_20860 [Actinobacteria bacterium]|nr:hypothetical protein [Actinomycetota bacterium]
MVTAGPPTELVQHPDVLAAYLGHPIDAVPSRHPSP